MNFFADILGSLREGGGGAILAPMAGISDVGMRSIAQDFGATFVVSEMVDSRFLAAGDRGSLARARGGAGHVVQIAGCTPSALAEAARLAAGLGAQATDINMGCPARKVVGGAAGSALMRDNATALIRAVRAAVGVPVSVKMRLGWDEGSRNAPELARRAEAEGAALVTVHGRTRCQFYNGRADWAAIAEVVAAVSIPVVANGDCCDVADARAMIAASGAAAVMIGRAAIGRPWLVGDIAHALRTGRERAAPTRERRRDCARQHYATLLSIHGEAAGVRHARKHLAGYASDAGFPPGTARHLSLVTQTDPDAVFAMLDGLYEMPADRAVAA